MDCPSCSAAPLGKAGLRITVLEDIPPSLVRNVFGFERRDDVCFATGRYTRTAAFPLRRGSRDVGNVHCIAVEANRQEAGRQLATPS